VRIKLRDKALSVSAVWGRCFQAEGRNFGHVIDPRTGQPASKAVLAAVSLPSATETDALSTALLTLGLEGHERISNLRPGIHTLVIAEGEQGYLKRYKGIEGDPVD
jgi:thiamine biosynthesis lipoprotein